MATTLALVQSIKNGIRDSTGAVVASAVIRCYDVGTLSAQTVYQDKDGSSAHTQPITANAGGQATIYLKNACRIIAKDSADDATVFDETFHVKRGEQVYITNDEVEGGTETTLHAYLTNGPSYEEGSSATSRYVRAWMKEAEIQVTDYGAVGDDSTDDTTAFQAAIDRALAADRTSAGSARTITIRVPAGTYKVNGAITAAITSGTKLFNLIGDGPTVSVIKQYGTAVDTLHLNYTSSTSAKPLVEGIGFTCSTATSGTAIKSTNGHGGTVRRCQFALYREAVDAQSETDWTIEDCEVVSTDGNASARGFLLGNDGVVSNCKVTGSSSNGIGVNCIGTNCKVSNVVATGWSEGLKGSGNRTRFVNVDSTGSTTGLRFVGANCYMTGGFIEGCTTGIDIDSAGCTAEPNYVTNNTTGINIAAVDRTRITGDVSGNTATISVHASATNTDLSGMRDGTNGNWPMLCGYELTDTTMSGGISVTPKWQGGGIFFNAYHFDGTAATVTFNAPSTTYLVAGAVIVIHVGSAGTGDVTFSFDSTYKDIAGNTFDSPVADVSGNPDITRWFAFRYDGTNWRELVRGMGEVNL